MAKPALSHDTKVGLFVFAFGALGMLFVGLLAVVIVGGRLGLLRVNVSGPESPVDALPVAGAFFAILLALLAITLYGVRSIVWGIRIQRRYRLFPEQPWRQDPDWDGGVLRANPALEARWYIYGAIGLTILLVSFAVPMLAKVRDARLLMLVVLAVVDGLLIRMAWKRTRASRRFGRVRLRLSQLPLVPGETFDAIIEIPGRVDGELTATLRCIRTETTGNRRDLQRHSADSLHRQRQQVPIGFRHDGCVARVSMTVPNNALATGDHRRGSVFWFLDVEGADGLDESFEVPVYDPDRSGDVQRFDLAA